MHWTGCREKDFSGIGREVACGGRDLRSFIDLIGMLRIQI